MKNSSRKFNKEFPDSWEGGNCLKCPPRTALFKKQSFINLDWIYMNLLILNFYINTGFILQRHLSYTIKAYISINGCWGTFFTNTEINTRRQPPNLFVWEGHQTKYLKYCLNAIPFLLMVVVQAIKVFSLDYLEDASIFLKIW